MQIPPSLQEFSQVISVGETERLREWGAVKRACTLKENYEFRRVYQRGSSAVSGAMVVYCRKNKLGRNRLGITASTKIGGAVTRNRARRRLREVYRLHRDKLQTGWDIILVARGRAAAWSWMRAHRAW